MIAYLEGKLLEITDTAIIVVTNGGTGFEVEIPSRTRQSLPQIGGRVALYTTLLVREDMMRLCGFSTFAEKETFEVLLTIPKVGPRTALGILSAFRPDDLRQVVLSGDFKLLTQVSGIGKRTAEAIFRELAYKLKVDPSEQVAVLAGNGMAGSVYRDAMEGLRSFGYTDGECGRLVQDLLHEEPDLDVAGVIRAVLKNMGRQKGKV